MYYKFFLHKTAIAFYLHKDYLNFERITSNPCEAANHGMKHKKSSLKSNMNINASMKSIHDQSCQKERMRQPVAFKSIISTAVWSRSETASYVSKLAEGVLNNEWNCRLDYTVIRSGQFVFKVLYNISPPGWLR